MAKFPPFLITNSDSSKYYDFSHGKIDGQHVAMSFCFAFYQI